MTTKREMKVWRPCQSMECNHIDCWIERRRALRNACYAAELKLHAGEHPAFHAEESES